NVAVLIGSDKFFKIAHIKNKNAAFSEAAFCWFGNPVNPGSEISKVSLEQTKCRIHAIPTPTGFGSPKNVWMYAENCHWIKN
ncbi:hypothetical protein, partial [Vibrio parahaemolyticus]|uniref:hypothetical protein n=1 Tax=Vibrio parahaemolyticus TaxID=670 RepID=UPI00146A1561